MLPAIPAPGPTLAELNRALGIESASACAARRYRMAHVKTLFKIGAISVGLLVASTAAEAKGCIKGAIVGGVGGHYIGRGISSLEEARAARRGTVPGAVARHRRWPTVVGAVAGCVAGREAAHRRAHAAARPAQPRPSRSAQTPAMRSVQPPAFGSAKSLHSRSIEPGR
jgi:hypothetical protein